MGGKNNWKLPVIVSGLSIRLDQCSSRFNRVRFTKVSARKDYSLEFTIFFESLNDIPDVSVLVT